ncbi:hypothetical protein FOL47_006465 [Perkinsus chesapeaki]|uniref:Caspase family p20 domain-containing protein n=1 Tax=Perkinsus chesapeaki TaxID=330153 RepID=A0A7J6LRR1_PERCH|nr:hypothetical protein FOL47_006465 [Perkinsus chesapeaki]
MSTSLHEAAAFGDHRNIITLIYTGEDPNAIDKGGFTPLHLAVKGGNLKAVQALMMCRADPNVKDSLGKSPKNLADELCEDMRLDGCPEKIKLSEKMRYFVAQRENGGNVMTKNKFLANSNLVSDRCGEAPLADSKKALIISQAHYHADCQNLHHGLADSKIVAERLERLGYAVTLGVNLNSKELQRYVSNAVEVESDRKVIYFIGMIERRIDGHGKRKSLLCGVDRRFSPAPQPEDLSLEEVIGKLSEKMSPNSSALVVVDATRDSTLTSELFGARSVLSDTGYLESSGPYPIEVPKGVSLLCAHIPNELLPADLFDPFSILASNGSLECLLAADEDQIARLAELAGLEASKPVNLLKKRSTKILQLPVDSPPPSVFGICLDAALEKFSDDYTRVCCSVSAEVSEATERVQRPWSKTN